MENKKKIGRLIIVKDWNDCITNDGSSSILKKWIGGKNRIIEIRLKIEMFLPCEEKPSHHDIKIVVLYKKEEIKNVILSQTTKMIDEEIVVEISLIGVSEFKKRLGLKHKDSLEDLSLKFLLPDMEEATTEELTLVSRNMNPKKRRAKDQTNDGNKQKTAKNNQKEGTSKKRKSQKNKSSDEEDEMTSEEEKPRKKKKRR